MHDELLLAEPALQTIDGSMKAKVINCKHDHTGNLIGNFHMNPMLNTRVYMARFQDGSLKCADNEIAEAIYNQVMDDEIDSTVFRNLLDMSMLHKKEQEVQNQLLIEAYLASATSCHTKPN